MGQREERQAGLSDQGNGDKGGLTREDGERQTQKQKDKIMVRMSQNAANYSPKESLILHISPCINMHVEFK